MKKLFCTVICSLAIFGVLIWCIELVAFDRSFYSAQYAKLETEKITNFAMKDLNNATDVLLSYMEGKRDNMEVFGTQDGEQIEIFNEREKSHMVDVVELVHRGIIFKFVSITAFMALIAYMYYKEKRRGLKKLSKYFLFGLGFDLFLVGMIGIFALINFDAFWTTFHLIFFDNGLWVLDQNVDVMIMMFPLAFFEAVVVRIVVYYVISLLLMALISLYCLRKKETLQIN